jgi:hypothetical protein
MENTGKVNNVLYTQNKELFDLSEELKDAAFLFLNDFNSRNFKLINFPAHKRIFLFFLTKVIKTYSSIYILCRQGYGQDACCLLRSLLETLISVKYILHDLNSADGKAVRFVEYKWVIFKRQISELEKKITLQSREEFLSQKAMINEKFNEYKCKNAIVSDRALLTWSGKSVKDMAKLVDKRLVDEYESAFRRYSRFSHPSIIGDKEYLNFEDDVLRLSPLPNSIEIITNLKKAITYSVDFLQIFKGLFNLNYAQNLVDLQQKIAEVFRMEKYAKDISLDKSVVKLNKESIDKTLVQFDTHNVE